MTARNIDPNKRYRLTRNGEPTGETLTGAEILELRRRKQEIREAFARDMAALGRKNVMDIVRIPDGKYADDVVCMDCVGLTRFLDHGIVQYRHDRSCPRRIIHRSHMT